MGARELNGWDSAAPAPAVLRAGAILQALAEAGGRPLSVADLAKAAGGIPRSSTVNVCAALVSTGLVRAATGGFVLGPGLVGLSQAYLDALDPVREFATRTRRMTPIDETLQLGTLEDGDVVYLAIHGGRQPLRITSRVGSRISATCTALGKAMLAGHTDERIRELLTERQPFPAYTARSITGIDALIEAVGETRERGYAVDDQETTDGITCLAVAVPGLPEATQPFAVSTSLLTGHATRERVETLVGLIRDLVSGMGHA
ncbi:IclR family transcriptional regulator [Phytomonospora endophytica]|uniref:DNA-binding IclR family transcriptional regulator n=1 Tax=Phytomonospora endophytica TaxID=714109 RepID=A0A841FGR3_9ACTN|nr:IclR family transcriptional regulator [Phytomonospora endophytica]MBB6034865.1 DNA-binding IclR family transcriptional regulator [Phytomonospora endophytica]GIG70568.1 IclR family transcriptional regulator [Phytomonospora endophytica]